MVKYVDDDDKYAFYDGGDADAKAAPKSDNDRKTDKYGDEAANFKLADTPMGKNVADGKSPLVTERPCTDIICLIIFLVAWGAMLFMTIHGYVDGHIGKLLAPIDGNFQICGYTPKVEHYPKLVITRFVDGAWATMSEYGVCATECPKATTTEVDCVVLRDVTAGRGTCHMTDTYDSHDILNFCVPTLKTIGKEVLPYLKGFEADMRKSSAGKYFIDLWKSSTAIFVCMGLAFLYAIIILKLMSLWAEVIAYICVVLLQLGLAGGCVVFIFTYAHAKDSITKGMKGFEKEKLDDEAALYMAFAVILGIFAILFMVCVCCFRH